MRIPRRPAATTTARTRALRALIVASAATAAAIVLPGGSIVNADATGSIATSATMTAGTSQSLDVSSVLVDPIVGDVIISLTITPLSATGSLAIGLDSTSGSITDSNCLVAATGTGIGCIWDTPPAATQAAGIQMTLTAPPEASGTFEILLAYADDASMTPTTLDTAVVEVSQSADLEVVKSVDDADVLPGDTVVFTLAYENLGPSDATGAAIIDVLPGGLTYVSDDAGCTNSAGVVNCDIGPLDAGTSGTVNITATVTADPGGAPNPLTNQGQINSFTTDPNSQNNIDSATTVVAPSADLSVTKTASADPVDPGDPLSYTISYRNDGPADATAVGIIDILPADVTFVSASPAGTCTEASPGVVNCDIGTVANGESGQVTVQVAVDPAAPTGSVLTNVVTINSAVADHDETNNAATARTGIETAADLVIGKSDDQDPVAAGGTLVYAIGYENLGPDTASAVQIVDTLPTGVTIESVTPATGSCDVLGLVITCNAGDLAVGAPAQILVEVSVDTSLDASTNLSNAASISSATHDPDPSNNTAIEDTAVISLADMSITKTGSVDPVQAGNQLSYTLTVTNSGPSDAADVVVTDTLPPGVTFVSATATQGTCSETSGTVTCSLGTVLALVPTQQITVVVTVPSDAPAGTLTNTATVSTTSEDDVPGNDSASASTAVTPTTSTSTSTTTSTTTSTSTTTTLPPTSTSSTTTTTPDSTSTTTDVPAPTSTAPVITAAPPVTNPSPTSVPNGALPATGSNTPGLATIAGLALLIGALAAWTARRRTLA